MTKTKTLSSLAALLFVFTNATADSLNMKVDWPSFLARQDLVYAAPPTSWMSGAFMGNGQLGAMVYAVGKGKQMNWHIGRSDVYFNVARAEFSGRISIGDISADSAFVDVCTGYDCVGSFHRPGRWPDLSSLPWTVHNYYLQYRYSMDEAMLRDRIFPLLKRSMNFYFHHMKKGPDGKLHTTSGFSPEYDHQPTPNPDCNVDLAMIRWSCQTLLDTCAKFKIDDPQIPQWKDTLANLTPYPVDKNGLMISASVPFARSHRHFAHLMMIYPLYIMNAEQSENRELVVKSLKHWMGLPGELAGFSYTAAASISAMLGEGDAARKYLHKLISWNRIGFNTHYMESGPCIETPLAAAASVHDMLLSSWGDKIRVFPSIPAAWTNFVIHNMRTEGAFLVSAERKAGKTQWVRMKSLAGEPCRIAPGLVGEVHATVPLKNCGNGVYELTLAKGEEALLYMGEKPPQPVIVPVTVEISPGVVGDGIHDDTAGLQALLDSGAVEVRFPVPPKFLLISKTLKIHSGQALIVERKSVIRLKPHSDCLMITNDDHEKGNDSIRLIGSLVISNATLKAEGGPSRGVVVRNTGQIKQSSLSQILTENVMDVPVDIFKKGK